MRWADRRFWVGLRRVWPAGREGGGAVVRPATVIAWHRRGFAWYWTWRSRPTGGRPRVNGELRRLIGEIAEANSLWGAPRSHDELVTLGLAVSERTVSRLVPRQRRPPCQNMAHLPAESHQRARRLRLLHRADHELTERAGGHRPLAQVHAGTPAMATARRPS